MPQPKDKQSKLGHHHNSPQKPNNCFIHKKVVGPRLLTFVSRGTPFVDRAFLIDEKSSRIPVQRGAALTHISRASSKTPATASAAAHKQKCSDDIHSLRSS